MYRPASRTVSLSKSPFGSFAKLPSKLQNFFVVLFCNFAAAAGDQTRKETLTVSFHTFLPSETSGWAAFSPARFAKTKCTARQAGRYISKKRKKERERKKRKSMKKGGDAIYGRHRIRAGDCPARTAPAHWPMLLALRSAPHRPCCQTRWAGGTSCRSARW